MAYNLLKHLATKNRIVTSTVVLPRLERMYLAADQFIDMLARRRVVGQRSGAEIRLAALLERLLLDMEQIGSDVQEGAMIASSDGVYDEMDTSPNSRHEETTQRIVRLLQMNEGAELPEPVQRGSQYKSTGNMKKKTAESTTVDPMAGDSTVLKEVLSCLPASTMSEIMEHGGRALIVDLLQERAAYYLVRHIVRLSERTDGYGVEEAAVELANLLRKEEVQAKQQLVEQQLQKLVPPLITLASAGSIHGQQQVCVHVIFCTIYLFSIDTRSCLVICFGILSSSQTSFNLVAIPMFQ